MEIVLDKSTATEALIKITLKEKDYQPQVEEKVKDYSKKANIKGFRQGKVPPSLIKRLYGKSIVVEEINSILSKSISEYIKENDIKLIGDPLPNHEKTAEIDWDTQKDFEFEYFVGLVDDFDYNLSQKIKAYQIEVDNKTVDRTIEDLKKKYGKYTEHDEIKEGDDFLGELNQEATDFKEDVWFTWEQLKPKEAKKFVGKKKEETLTIEPKKIFNDAETAAEVLRKSEKELKELKGDFELTIKKISHVEPARLDQEFFNKIFGEDVVKSEEEFRNKVKESLQQNYEADSKNYTLKLIQDKLLETTEIDIPESFYKKWLKITQEEKMSEEEIDKNFDKHLQDLKWTLIVNKVAEDNEIKVEHEEVVEHAKQLIKAQFAAYGMTEQMEENLNSFADNYLRGNEGQNYYNTYNKVHSEKIMNFIMDKMDISYKKVKPEEFSKIVSNQK